VGISPTRVRANRATAKLAALPLLERETAIVGFAEAVPSGCISGAIRKVRPALAAASRIVEDTRQYFRGDDNVARMADLIEKTVRTEIAEDAETDAEALKV
jgi:hypothetical protein